MSDGRTPPATASLTERDQNASDLLVTVADTVTTIEINRPPLNFFDADLIGRIADETERLSGSPSCRVIVLAARGKVFCAGADFGDPETFDVNGDAPGAPTRADLARLYENAARLFACTKPIIAAVHGAAIGGGFGLAMMADFRVTCAEARFSANFNRLGIHPGFGLTVTLPRLVGHQKAALIFATARRFTGEEAVALGLADILAAQDNVRPAANELAQEIAANAPLAVQATRGVLRAGLSDAVRAATPSELEIQTELRRTGDFREGVAAAHARRAPTFTGT